jgi:7-carboxy-7-deazaguanine synthase
VSDRLRINEIFYSIQGESTWAGRPCVFVRLTACNLRCTWCDTAYSFHEGQPMKVGDVIVKVLEYNCPLVEITGGEPLLQAATPALARRLLKAGHTVLVETNGSQPIEVLPKGVIRIMDLKCPDSGECDLNRYENVAQLRPGDEVKFVLASRGDYEWAREQIAKHRLHRKAKAVLLSVAFGKLEPASVVEWMLADKLPARFQLQLHKFIWRADAQGV